MEEIHSSPEAGVEVSPPYSSQQPRHILPVSQVSHSILGDKIDLPSLIEEERKKQIITTFRYTRERYRQFRSKLSQDIQQSNGERIENVTMLKQ
jgi:hypothetical protein